MRYKTLEINTMEMKSAVILAGGEARRAHGQDKSFFIYEGLSFIERQISVLEKIVDEIIIVARDHTQCKKFESFQGVRVVSDLRPGMGPIGGIHAALHAVRGDLFFLSACDMPCLEPSVIEYLFSLIGSSDAVIPSWNKEMFEPMHAIYRVSALREYLLDYESYSLRSMIKRLNSTFIPVEMLKVFDPELKTFTNINRLEELDWIARRV